MKLDDDPLFKEVHSRFEQFANEAKKHKRLNRFLWALSAGLSALVGLGTNFPLSLGPTTSTDIAAGIAIILPAVTAYTVLRSPEQLWIMEIGMRNRLSDLQTRFRLEFERDPNFDRRELQEEFLRLMAEANGAWLTIKRVS